jgi:hypothetical protein
MMTKLFGERSGGSHVSHRVSSTSQYICMYPNTQTPPVPISLVFVLIGEKSMTARTHATAPLCVLVYGRLSA